MNKEIELREEDFIPSTLMFIKYFFKHCIRNINHPKRNDIGHRDWDRHDIRAWLHEQQKWCLSEEGEFWFHTWEEITTMSWDKLRQAFLRLIDRKLIENEKEFEEEYNGTRKTTLSSK